MRKMRTELFPSELQDRFIIRMPDGMRDKLKDLAKRNRRSMNAEIVDRLIESLARDECTTDPVFSIQYSDSLGMISGCIGVNDSSELHSAEEVLLSLFRCMSTEKKKALIEFLK